MQSRKTIDNLGPEVSLIYAEGQKNLDPKITKEAKGIVSQAQIDVTQPCYPSEFEMLFELGKRNLPWAEFEAPSKFNEQKKRVFTHQLIPSLGSEDKKENLTQKIVARLQSYESKRQQDYAKNEPIDPKKIFQQQQLSKELEKQKNSLIKLLDCILNLDKDINIVNGKRSQYQKG
ncbi:MAG: hypothetical protein EBZ47_05860 [Chlamydiae bacterium]|nr:hypothetical protein [Chlamydiota bacterium]